MRFAEPIRSLAGLALAGLLVTCTLLVPAPTQAQSAEAEVVAVVERLFEGMRTRDTTMMRGTFDGSARLYGITPAGVIQATPMDDFLRSIAGAPADLVLDEKVYAPEVRIDGNLATVWTFYTLHLGERFSHCGIDAFTLYRTAESWKIVTIGDTRRTENCEPPGD
jgi:hypothetical protein